MGARKRTEGWAAATINKVRSRELVPPSGSAAWVAAQHRDTDGNLLDARTAGEELHNIVRPTIAVCRFASFLALALIDHPEWPEGLRTEAAELGIRPDAPKARAFAQEVRRFYPFVPMLPARARADLEFDGHRIDKGQRVLINVLGTNTDPELWEHPGEFRPERFPDSDLHHAEYFIPQGIVEHAQGVTSV